ncbi:MAG: radical SAM protein [Deltaproteobacteria bacterium]|nr:radical SAM protein [Deltaproteobacteria bacterium]
MQTRQPSYIKLYENGELNSRIAKLNERMSECTLCPRRCRARRFEGDKGVCSAGQLPIVASAQPHFGEEPPLTGWAGSGTIFMSHCNMRCVYCQNADISQGSKGDEVSLDELSTMMVMLQRKGCHNVNFVTPTHQIAQIVAALPKAIENGLSVPLVYNSGGYEEPDAIRLLDGIFDIYMPDLKYGDDDAAFNLSAAIHYVRFSFASAKEMHRQVGDLVVDKNGVALSGLIVRHLILPNGLAGTSEVMRFIAHELSVNTYVNIMGQYRPCHKAGQHPAIDRRITPEEYDEAIRIAKGYGLVTTVNRDRKP